MREADMENFTKTYGVNVKTSYKKNFLSLSLANSYSFSGGDSTRIYHEHVTNSSIGEKTSINMHSVNFRTPEFRATYNGSSRLLALASDQDEWGIGKLPERENPITDAKGEDEYIDRRDVLDSYLGRDYWCLGQEHLLWAAYINEKNITLNSVSSNFGINLKIAMDVNAGLELGSSFKFGYANHEASGVKEAEKTKQTTEEINAIKNEIVESKILEYDFLEQTIDDYIENIKISAKSEKQRVESFRLHVMN